MVLRKKNKIGGITLFDLKLYKKLQLLKHHDLGVSIDMQICETKWECSQVNPNTFSLLVY